MRGNNRLCPHHYVLGDWQSDTSSNFNLSSLTALWILLESQNRKFHKSVFLASHDRGFCQMQMQLTSMMTTVHEAAAMNESSDEVVGFPNYDTDARHPDLEQTMKTLLDALNKSDSNDTYDEYSNDDEHDDNGHSAQLLYQMRA